MTNLNEWRAAKLEELAKCKECPKYRACWKGVMFVVDDDNAAFALYD